MDQEQTPVRAEVRRKAEALEHREFQIWSITVLMLLVVAAGLVALMLPNVMWNTGTLPFDGRYAPQLFFGFIALIILFSVHTLIQRRILRSTREELIRQLARSESPDHQSLIDPLTEIFNRRYLDQILVKEVSRADRGESCLTFLVVDVDGFRSVNQRFGNPVGDRVLCAVGQLLMATFRRSDTVVRYGNDEFLVVMPETKEDQALHAVERLLKQVDHWNRENAFPGYRLSLSCGLATYTKGSNVANIIDAAEKRLSVHKAAHPSTH